MKKTLLFLGGEAGIGKTSLARLFSQRFNFIQIDKDSFTFVFTEAILEFHSLSPYDRESSFYLDEVRPLEYEQLSELLLSLMSSKTNHNIVITAPFFDEFGSSTWVNSERLKALLYEYEPIFVYLSPLSPRTVLDRLKKRAEDRDIGKISNWNVYRENIDNKIGDIKKSNIISFLALPSDESLDVTMASILSIIDAQI